MSCTAYDIGYTCSGGIGSTSSCTGICGDGIRVAAEICDNGNKVGCSVNCKQDYGYTCTGVIGAISNCFTTCGDNYTAGT